jgi:putative transposase
MTLVEQRSPGVSVVAACVALAVSRAALYRARQPVSTRGPAVLRPRAPSPRRLGEAERQAILDTLHLDEFADQPPTEVYATLLGRGQYIGSIRTIYRVLADAGEVRERRNQRTPHHHAMPSLTATTPNQVWTWDITKLATEQKGVFLMAYVIIDLFSRFVVGWMVATKECKHLAAQLFSETIARHGIEPGLNVHADRGSAMKSDTLAQLLDSLGASRSFSRPRVSNDNAFSEAQFKTLKYQPDYPGRFGSVLHGRAWLGDFFAWHNEHHHHAGLALFTPSDVFHGRVAAVAAVRQDTLDAAYLAHPERFPNGPPQVPLPPSAVYINPITAEAAVDVSSGGDNHLAPPKSHSVTSGSAPHDMKQSSTRAQALIAHGGTAGRTPLPPEPTCNLPAPRQLESAGQEPIDQEVLAT